jgi:MFS family permease
MTPLWGRVTDIVGRKYILYPGIVVFAVGSALCGASQSMNMLIASRALQGIGGGAIMSLTQIIIGDIVPLAKRGIYNSFFGAVWGISSCVGPVLGKHFVICPSQPLLTRSFAVFPLLARLQAESSHSTETIGDGASSLTSPPQVSLWLLYTSPSTLTRHARTHGQCSHGHSTFSVWRSSCLVAHASLSVSHSLRITGGEIKRQLRCLLSEGCYSPRVLLISWSPSATLSSHRES